MAARAPTLVALKRACELSCSRELLRLDRRVGAVSHQPTS